jgi:mRNA interferase RelE/StbE
MAYWVSIRRKAQKQLDRIQKQHRERVIADVLALAEDPRPPGCRKLRGREEWRVRVGDYRAIYEIDDERREVLVLDIGHRRDIYR